MKLWSLHEKEATKTLEHKRNTVLFDIHLTRDGSLVAARCSLDIRVWRSRDGQILHDIDSNRWHMTFAGEFLLVASENMFDQPFHMYRLSTGLLHHQFHTRNALFKNKLYYLALSPDGNWAAMMDVLRRLG